jgi:hypothetical protein
VVEEKVDVGLREDPGLGFLVGAQLRGAVDDGYRLGELTFSAKA